MPIILFPELEMPGLGQGFWISNLKNLRSAFQKSTIPVQNRFCRGGSPCYFEGTWKGIQMTIKPTYEELGKGIRELGYYHEKKF